MKFMTNAYLLLLVVPLAPLVAPACSDSDGDGVGGAGLDATGGSAGAGAGVGLGGAGGGTGAGGPCTLGDRACADTEHELICEPTDDEPHWVIQSCATHHYCIVDRCEPACLDECAIGSTRSVDGQQEICQLYSTAEQAFITPSDGMHDRSRLHDAWMREHQLANGYVAEALHTDVSYVAVAAYLGTVDSAEWTGTYLAAEALRLMATRSPDSERMVETLVESVHELFEITGEAGSMARIWAHQGEDPLLDALYDANDWSHHLTTFQGGSAFWHGWTSRDMYAGIMVGLGLAYDALSSETHREMIRQDVVPLAMELIKERPQVPVTVRFHFAGDWQEQELLFDMQHVVLVPDEMVNGRVFIQIGTDDSSSDYNASELLGAREFLPNFTTALGQVPLFGPLLPPIPRPGSAMMLANFMRVALQVTEGDPSWASERAAIDAHYQANRDGWLEIMKQYAYHNENECWKQYFGMTIAYHPIYSLIRLEPDGPFKTSLQQDVLGAKMWPTIADHFNAYFTYIAASQGPTGLVPAPTLEQTAVQLGQFVAPPKARIAVDNTGNYPADPQCPGLSSVPVSIGDRVPMDFIFQHHPFRLTTPDPEPRLVHAGADYLVAYWLGRYHDQLTDDGPDICLRWAAE